MRKRYRTREKRTFVTVIQVIVLTVLVFVACLLVVAYCVSLGYANGLGAS